MADNRQNGRRLSTYLSPAAAWALAFGCSVGWGSFVMPGTTFLPTAGPWGTVLGLGVGALIMALIGMNYYHLMNRFPGAGGAYTYAKRVLGFDHGFLCAWMLLLTYIAIIWANSTALSLIVRYVFGDMLCFGFSYEIAGYTIYFGETLLSAVLLLAAALVCILGKRLMKWVQTVCAVLLFVCVTACFIAVTVHNGGFEKLSPAFAQGGDPAVQVLSIVILAPWAFVGFESISHSAGEFRFPVKKSLPVMLAALLTGAMTYIMLTLCATMATPDGFSGWGEYIAALKTQDGIHGLPTFFAAQQAMGDAGLALLSIAAFCGIVTGLIANYVALSRLIHSLSNDGMMFRRVGDLSKKGIPSAGVLIVAGCSCLITLLGRTSIGWIVDVTTIGAAIIYSYTSITAFVAGRRENHRPMQVFGVAGAVISLIFALFYLMPNFLSRNKLATESYLLLMIWSVLGMAVFCVLIHRDKTRKLGKSEIVWVMLLVLVLMVSLVWIHQVTVEEAKKITGDIASFHYEIAQRAGMTINNSVVHDTDDYITTSIHAFSTTVMKNVAIQVGLVVCSMAIIFSIFSIIKKREKQIEAERLLAEESSKAKSAFLSNMSHDIRTPMNAITGYTALALKEDVPDKVRDYLEKIETSGEHLLSLINDILDMSRIESGKMELDNAPADLTALIDETYSIFEVQMASKKLRFTADYSGVRNRCAVCDKFRLTRILLNLLSNACKFTPEGGAVTVTLTEQEDGCYALCVADTGIGMSEEFAARIFEPFEREHTQTVEKIQGTGLGMSITKNLVELMGGTITLKTEKDKGTEFLIRLRFPVAPEDSVRADEPLQKEEGHIDFFGKRLLLAEDNPINSEIACAILSQEGFAVDVAENGRIAAEMMEKADDDTYCMMLTDIQMPEMNGYELIRAVRAMDGKKGQIPIIAMTANTFDDDRRAAAEAGVNAYVGKPFRPEELLKTIASLLG